VRGVGVRRGDRESAPRVGGAARGDFLRLWLALTVSRVGTQLSSFALAVWIYERSGSATLYGLTALASLVPMLALAPLAGIAVDRWPRRHLLLVAEAGGALCAAVLAAAALTDQLSIAFVIAVVALSSTFTAFQSPALAAATTTMVPEAQLGRANALWQLSTALSCCTPLLGGLLLHGGRVDVILIADCATFLAAFALLAWVRIPPPARTAEGAARGRSLGGDLLFGWRYIRGRRALIALVIVSGAGNLALGMAPALITPLALSFADSRALGVIVTASAIGAVAGGLVMLAWGGPRRKIDGALGLMALEGMLYFLAAAPRSVALASIGAFAVVFLDAIAASCKQVVWQRAVPPDAQGRVLAMALAFDRLLAMVGFVAAGPLCDHIFEPLMADGCLLGGSLAQAIGAGPGRGAALLFALLGAMVVLAAVIGYLYPPLRRVEAHPPSTHIGAGVSGCGLPRKIA